MRTTLVEVLLLVTWLLCAYPAGLWFGVIFDYSMLGIAVALGYLAFTALLILIIRDAIRDLQKSLEENMAA